MFFIKRLLGITLGLSIISHSSYAHLPEIQHDQASQATAIKREPLQESEAGLVALSKEALRLYVEATSNIALFITGNHDIVLTEAEKYYTAVFLSGLVAFTVAVHKLAKLIE